MINNMFLKHYHSFCSVCLPTKGLEICLQDRNPIVSRAFLSPHQYAVGQHDGKRGWGKYTYE